MSRTAQPGMPEGQPSADDGAGGIPSRPLDRAARRAAIEAALKERPEASNRTIASDLGVSHPTVAGVREEMESTGKIFQFEKTIGADGKTRRRPPPRSNTASSGIDADIASRVAALERQEAVNAVVALTVAKLCEYVGFEAPATPHASDWIQIKEAAARLEYSESGIRNLIRRGKVESMTTPAGKVRIRAASLPKCD